MSEQQQIPPPRFYPLSDADRQALAEGGHNPAEFVGVELRAVNMQLGMLQGGIVIIAPTAAIPPGMTNQGPSRFMAATNPQAAAQMFVVQELGFVLVPVIRGCVKRTALKDPEVAEEAGPELTLTPPEERPRLQLLDDPPDAG